MDSKQVSKKEEKRMDVRDVLVKLRNEAAERRTPNLIDDESAAAIPQLFSLVAPAVLSVKKEGSDKLTEVVRQPIMTVFWDSGSLQWSVGITDRQMGFKVTCGVGSLLRLMEHVEVALQTGKHSVKVVDAKVKTTELV